jgi:hypothetical protein
MLTPSENSRTPIGQNSIQKPQPLQILMLITGLPTGFKNLDKFKGLRPLIGITTSIEALPGIADYQAFRYKT